MWRPILFLTFSLGAITWAQTPQELVQDAIQKWGKFTLVYEPQQADIVLVVMSRPSEDVLAVYDARGWPGNQYRWRMMGRNGLQQSETPFVTDMEKAFEKATKR